MTFADLLSSRLSELGTTQTALASELSERGIPTTKQSVNAWCRGETRPDAWKRTVIYDALAVPLCDRQRWTDALLARRDGAADGHDDSSVEVLSTTS
jgi:hypothetical protein